MRCPPREVTPRCSVVGLASGQSPTEPIRQRREPSSHRYSQATPVHRTAGAAGFVGVDFHYEPLASETGACKPVQRATQWSSARYGTSKCSRSRRLTGPPRSPVARDQPPGGSAGLSANGLPSASLPPSHLPTDGLLVGCTPAGPRGPLLIFRKIHLYGRTKKSTHGHQTMRPSRTPLYDGPPADATGRGESIATPPALARGQGEAPAALVLVVSAYPIPYPIPCSTELVPP